MSILGLIDVMPEGEAVDKKRGDFIFVCLEDYEFGTEEVKNHQVVEIEDDVLQGRLNAMKAAGERPVIIYPYAEFEEDVNGRPVMVQRSTRYIDVDALPNANEIKNPNKEVEKITESESSKNEKTRTSKVGKLSAEDRKRLGLP